MAEILNTTASLTYHGNRRPFVLRNVRNDILDAELHLAMIQLGGFRTLWDSPLRIVKSTQTKLDG